MVAKKMSLFPNYLGTRQQILLTTTLHSPRLHYRTAEYSGYPDEGGVLSGVLFLQSKIRGRNRFISIIGKFRSEACYATYVIYRVLPIELFLDPSPHDPFPGHVNPVG
jgi:hypothetical protein